MSNTHSNVTYCHFIVGGSLFVLIALMESSQFREGQDEPKSFLTDLEGYRKHMV